MHVWLLFAKDKVADFVSAFHAHFRRGITSRQKKKTKMPARRT
jgi:hypothetical protein